METIFSVLENDPYVTTGSVKSWNHDYLSWLQKQNLTTCRLNIPLSNCKLTSLSEFNINLKIFLASEFGKVYRRNIVYDNDNTTIRAASIEFKHTSFDTASAEIIGMDSIQEKINPDFGLLPHPDPNDELLPFCYTRRYINWESNKVISEELRRNLGLASACVFVVSLFLISHLGTSLMVLLCVVLALVDIAGFMHFWDLTIDTVTTIILVIAIGLTVDYSAHIAHGFMASGRGDKNRRVTDALTEIGPAVIHGGMSTLLAFILLAASESYVFFTFFKVFFLVVVFGMFHGMVFLPVLLSLIGPGPYKVDHSDRNRLSFYNNPKREKETSSIPADQPVRLDKIKRNGETYTNEKGSTENQSYTPDA